MNPIILSISLNSSQQSNETNSKSCLILDPATEARTMFFAWKRACKEARKKGKRNPLYPSCPYPAGPQRDQWMWMIKMCKTK